MMFSPGKLEQVCLPAIFLSGLAGRLCCLLVVAVTLVGCGSTSSRGQASPREVPAGAASGSPVSSGAEAVSPAPAAVMPVLVDENNIFFAPSVTAVDKAGEDKLRQHAERLKQDPDIVVTLVGHTDDLGSRNYNLAIAEQRLMAVNKLLRTYGVPAKQIRRYRGDGEKIPETCKSASCRQQMRRVELIYKP